MDNEHVQSVILTYQHTYFSNGFSISKAMTEDGKGYTPISTHACLLTGHWCFKELKETPKHIFPYLLLILFTPIRFIQKKISSIFY